MAQVSPAGAPVPPRRGVGGGGGPGDPEGLPEPWAMNHLLSVLGINWLVSAIDWLFKPLIG